jgi:hypothetical protein
MRSRALTLARLRNYVLQHITALDETRNDGEAERELLLRPEAEVLLGRDVRQCWPTARIVRFLQPEAADPSRRTNRRAPRHRESKSALGLRSPNLVPTYDRGSMTAARPVDLAAAIAHRQQHADGRWRACSWREAVATL